MDGDITNRLQLLKKEKPTGDAELPPVVTRALEIDQALNAYIGSRELDDSEFEADAPNVIEITSSEDKKVAILRRPDRHQPQPQPQPRRQATKTGVDIMNKIANNFDPGLQHQRDMERADRSISNVQILTISQQLRDSQSTVNTLRSEITGLLTRLHTSEIARERSELKLELLTDRRLTFKQRYAKQRYARKRPRVRRYRLEEIERQDGHISYETVTATESLTSDSDKENRCQHYGHVLKCPRRFPLPPLDSDTVKSNGTEDMSIVTSDVDKDAAIVDKDAILVDKD